MTTGTLDVGNQDIERKNSPIAWETDEDTEALREEIPLEPICYFNDVAFADGTMVKSGNALLRCDKGIWVPAGSNVPESP